MSKRWERILVVAGVCVPVPLFGLSGLAMPLPPAVERIAAALVPWADAATLDGNQALAVGARGSVVLVPGERPRRSSRERDRRVASPDATDAAGGGKIVVDGGKGQDSAAAVPASGDGTSSEPAGGQGNEGGGGGGGSGGGGGRADGDGDGDGTLKPVTDEVESSTTNDVVETGDDDVDGLASELDED